MEQKMKSKEDKATVRLAHRACTMALADLQLGGMTREQVRMIGVVGSTYGIFRKSEPTEPYLTYITRVVDRLTEEVEKFDSGNH
jgi:hypothetical protein